MENFSLADIEIVTVVGFLVIIFFLMALRGKVDLQSKVLEGKAKKISIIEDKLSEIQGKLLSIESGIEMITPDSARVDMLVRQGFDRGDAWEIVHKWGEGPDHVRLQFDSLPDFLADSLKGISSGTEIPLLLLNDVGGHLSTVPIQYIHRELTYRSSNERDPLAYGQARIGASGEMKDVRILFNRPHATATMRGLEVEGHVKKAR